jgi:hypothetical protein
MQLYEHHAMKIYQEMEINFYKFSTSAADGSRDIKINLFLGR